MLDFTTTSPTRSETVSAFSAQTPFQRLQRQMSAQFRDLWTDPLRPRVVVVVPSITLDETLSAHLPGDIHYEERLLCLLMLLRQPRTRLIYVSSLPIAPAIVDYYLHLLPGVPGAHARKRLTLLNCHDTSARPLTRKILERPRLMERIRQELSEEAPAHLTCYNVTELEAQLSVELGIPLYGCDPALLPLGSKSGSRQLFREAGVPLPDGSEDLFSENEVIDALAALKRRQPTLRKAVVKLNEGFSGKGNATVSLSDAPTDEQLTDWLRQELPHRLRLVDHELTYETFFAQLKSMGGIVEAFIDGGRKTSPSVQCRIDPLGGVSVISTHDQILDEETGQEYLGCRFPADAAYHRDLAEAGHRIASRLRERGVLGRFGVDFMSVQQADGSWKSFAIEINLRKGGTTHPFLLLQFLTDGQYNPEKGEFELPKGGHLHYFASDNLHSERYRGLTPDDLMDILVLHALHYDSTVQEGVVFHMMGALSEFGKLGVTAIAHTPERAYALYERVVEVLNGEVLD
ncbi:peptide ligase PGM1-related protein [Tellurirhabdus rosea]|uniref:peptide ligase PGM1-related protein n=1 Tax=Tellurirhabdus rosea TaxID=2674997 RepID=UPI002252A9ED|nr:peptide ligase PGM1-related protein [Tellurirhabdus rosea]